ncbi:hypothetical protein [Streptomyces albicerus]|uniref:hypothetical protein n=1 Tax=Streptomyces albicerus TaxID=2569859 RepID=UPI00124B6CF5|nr:hypothetical protein [Streptomyces albicerus]
MRFPSERVEIQEPLLYVCPEGLNYQFDELRSKCGFFSAYEKWALGLDSKELRALERDLLVG